MYLIEKLASGEIIGRHETENEAIAVAHGLVCAHGFHSKVFGKTEIFKDGPVLRATHVGPCGRNVTYQDMDDHDYLVILPRDPQTE